jgi:hypothetical protein
MALQTVFSGASAATDASPAVHQLMCRKFVGMSTKTPRQLYAALSADAKSADGWCLIAPAGRFRAGDGRPAKPAAGWIVAEPAALVDRLNARQAQMCVDYEHASLSAAKTGVAYCAIPSATITFLKRPMVKNMIPAEIAVESGRYVLASLNCCIICAWCNTGPAIRCGKYVTNSK